jgi:nucleotide-binding universal stress UspA family protein
MTTIQATTKISLRNILFATDFSEHSAAALPYAISLAEKYGAKILAAHVIPAAVPAHRGSWDVSIEHVEREAKEKLEKLAPKLHGIPHELVLGMGPAWKMLSGIIQESQVDLVVIGTHGRTGAEKLLMGSVAEEIFRRSPCPVLTIGPRVTAKPESVTEIHEVLYPTDFGAGSQEAAAYAISLAQEHQARLTLLHVVERLEETTRDPQKTVISFLGRLQDLVPSEAELWCRAKPFVVFGHVAEQILDLAKERGADLIVLGVRHAGAFPGIYTHAPWGIAFQVVREAHCPVLTVRG